MTRNKKGVLDPPAPSTGLDAHETREVGAGVFKDKCLQLLDDVQANALELVVTKHGEPVAKVVPVGTHMTSAFGFLRGTVLAQRNIVAPDFDSWGDLG